MKTLLTILTALWGVLGMYLLTVFVTLDFAWFMGFGYPHGAMVRVIAVICVVLGALAALAAREAGE